MVRFTVDNRNRLIFYGNPVGYVKADTAVVDEMFRTDELNQYLSRMNLTPRWEDGIFDRLVSSEVTGEELAQSRKGCRIWQLKKDVDVAMRFIGYEDQVRKFGEPDAENYTLVFDGDLGTSDLEQIYTICRDAPPPGYQGYRMALSDVVELYDDSLIRQITDAMETEIIPFPGGTMGLGDIERRLRELEQQFQTLLEKATDDPAAYGGQFKEILDEQTLLKERRSGILADNKEQAKANQRIMDAAQTLENVSPHITEWDESAVRQLVETVKVLSKDEIAVTLKGGIEIRQKIMY